MIPSLRQQCLALALGWNRYDKSYLTKGLLYDMKLEKEFQ